jgi:Protein of unknown function (DUF3261)
VKRALVVTLVALACTHPRPPPMPAVTHPGTLVSTREIRGAFMFRQRVEAHTPLREVSFDAVLQKQGDTLTLLGLTPFGTRAFVLQQRDLDVSFTSHMPGELPFPPRYMLLDIHRTLFIGLGPPPAVDGERTGTRDGEEIRELWRGGRLLERHFRRPDNAPPGTIDVRYVGGMEGDTPPRTIELHNGWMGYSLTITTLDAQRLDTPVTH